MVFANLNHGIQTTNVSNLYLSNFWAYNNKAYGYYGSNDMVRYYNNNYIFNNATNITSWDFVTGTSAPL